MKTINEQNTGSDLNSNWLIHLPERWTSSVERHNCHPYMVLRSRSPSQITDQPLLKLLVQGDMLIPTLPITRTHLHPLSHVPCFIVGTESRVLGHLRHDPVHKICPPAPPLRSQRPRESNPFPPSIFLMIQPSSLNALKLPLQGACFGY